MTEPKPIATAPRDGTTIWVWAPREECWVPVAGSPDRSAWMIMVPHDFDRGIYLHDEQTHWLPDPPPPI